MQATLSFPTGRALDLIPLGRIGLDLYPDQFNASFEEVSGFTVSLGGSPANVAIGAAKLGLRTGFLGRMCDDGIAGYLKRRLREVNINTEGLTVDQSTAVTGLAFVEILSPTQCNTIMYRDNAVDLKLEPGDIDEDYLASARCLLISGTALSQRPSREATMRAIELAHAHGLVVAMDIDYRPYSWTSPEETAKVLSDAASQCHLIIGNNEEFDVMLPGQDPEAQVTQWFNHQAQLVMLKHGKEGSTAFLKDGQKHTAGIFEVEAKMTNGSGDAFAAGLLYQLMQGSSIETAMQFGSACASLNLLGDDCSYAMPTLEQVEAFLTERVGSATGGQG